MMPAEKTKRAHGEIDATSRWSRGLTSMVGYQCAFDGCVRPEESSEELLWQALLEVYGRAITGFVESVGRLGGAQRASRSGACRSAGWAPRAARKSISESSPAFWGTDVILPGFRSTDASRRNAVFYAADGIELGPAAGQLGLCGVGGEQQR